MKRPTIECALIYIGVISGILGLITAKFDLSNYGFLLPWSILIFAPFLLPWHLRKHPYLHLICLIIPAHVLFIELNKFIHLYQALLAGKHLWDGLSFEFPLAFLNMHLFIPGILILIFYAISQTLKYRTTPLTQLP